MEQQGGATSRLKRQAITMRKPYLDTAHAIQAEVLKRPLVGLVFPCDLIQVLFSLTGRIRQ